jgi:hypothetical protein
MVNLKIKRVVPYFVLALACVLCAIFIDFTNFKLSAVTSAVAGILAVVFLAVGLLLNKKINPQTICLIIFVLGFVLKLCYIAYTPYNVRQHDVYNFNIDGSGGGHARYILWFFQENHFPDFDPRSIWQFYHPPLHHIIAGTFMRFLSLFGLSFERICEAVQVLPLFYSSSCAIVFYRILEELKIKKSAKIFSFLLIFLNPSFIIFSGSINNDILSVLFMMGAFLYTVRWYKQREFKNIIPLAFCIGLGMMSKLSASLIAPAVAAVFLYCLIKNFKAEWKKLFLQFLVFGVICVPLGMWYSVRNLILFDIPLGYVPLIGSDVDQYIGFRSVFERLFDFTLNDVFMAWGQNRGGFFEHNVFLGLLKTSVFGEFRLSEMSSLKNGITLFSTVLFVVNVFIALYSFIAMICVLTKKKIRTEFKLFSLILYVTVLYSYVSFCFSYPHTCTMNIRYAVPLIVLGAVFIGLFTSRAKTRFEKVMRNTLYVIIPMFCLTTCIVYTMLGI